LAPGMVVEGTLVWLFHDSLVMVSQVMFAVSGVLLAAALLPLYWRLHKWPINSRLWGKNITRGWRTGTSISETE
jgi:hypothetical protein